MPFLVAIGVLFLLTALGIWGYFTFTKSGRKANVESTLDDAYLEDKLMDSMEETQEVLEELSARKAKLLNK